MRTLRIGREVSTYWNDDGDSGKVDTNVDVTREMRPNNNYNDSSGGGGD